MLRQITYREAIREALDEEMARNERVVLIGEDIGIFSGAFKVTETLLDKYGEKRIQDTPLAESSLMACAVGGALVGLRPVVEIMFADFVTIAMEHIVNSAAKMHFLYDDEACVPLVLRTPQGAGTSSGAHHCQSVEGWLMNIPGIKIVLPSTPYDAKGLLKSAIRDNNPVAFLEHKMLYASRGFVPEGEYLVPLGQAEIKRTGKDITIIAFSAMVDKAIKAAKVLAKEGIEVEVVDPRTLIPLDKETLLSSLRKTRRILVVHEGCRTGGAGAEIVAVLGEEGFDYLDAPIARIGAPDMPVPFSPPLEQYYIPKEIDIIREVKKALL